MIQFLTSQEVAFENINILSKTFDEFQDDPTISFTFSFNNCNIVQCAEAAESGYKSYLTPQLLNNIFDELGFEIIQYRSTSINVHWVEIKKPGVLTTTKRHQTLGKICAVNA